MHTKFYLLVTVVLAGLLSCNTNPSGPTSTQAFTSDLKQRTFNYFWELADTATGQTPDRYPTRNFTSIAATGFALPAYIIGIQNQYITREQAAQRTLHTLQWLWQSRQSADSAGSTGYQGFYYHFLNYGTGTRYRDVELSTIDTGLLMAGILTAQSYYTENNPTETQIRQLADSLYLRVNWQWAMNGDELMSMGWRPEKGFIPARWGGYNEAMILILMALGSPTYPIHDQAWQAWCEGYQWHSFYGYEHVNFAPLFGHQYSHMFIDFRGIQDAYMREKGIDYFENARRATLSNRAYCMANPSGFSGYSENIWGLTASDGPGYKQQVHGSDTIQFYGYHARGASKDDIRDDGTLVPTAAGGSIPFAPKECLTALATMKTQFGSQLYQEYGFKDAFNLTYRTNNPQQPNWFNKDYISIDQGPILIMLENHETGLIWDILKMNPYLIRGLKKAGFTGGWIKTASSDNH